MKTIHVRAIWDDEAQVWVATSDDVPGLVAEAPTQDELRQALIELIPSLLSLNDGHELPQEIPIELHQESHFLAETA